MMSRWHEIPSAEAYALQRYELLVKLETKVSQPYLDTATSDGGPVPTIGIGFNLRTNMHAVAVELLGSEWSRGLEKKLLDVAKQTYASGENAKLRANLKGVLQEWRLTHPGAPKTFALTDAQIVAIFNGIAPNYESVVDRWLASIPESRERLALFSLAFNSPTLLGKGLKKAISTNNRAEAWWEIRYHSNANQNDRNLGAGIANRRYLEAYYFNLYENGPVSTKAALDVGTMYARHRTESREAGGILAYEKKFDPLKAATSKQEPGITDIAKQLQPAIHALRTEFGIPLWMSFEELLVASGTNSNLSGDGTAFDSLENDYDLLIGSAQANVLNGGAGNDALIGQGGNDVLQGGDGDDWLVGGTGRDRMEGGRGRDTYFVDNAQDVVVEPDSADPYDVDTLYIEAPASINATGIEQINVTNQLDGQVKVVGGTGLFARLSQGADSFWLEINEIRPSPYSSSVSIASEGGADTMKVSTTVDVYRTRSTNDPGVGVNLEANSTADRIDLTSFDISRIVVGTLDASVEHGVFLLAPLAGVRFGEQGEHFFNMQGWSIFDVSKPGQLGLHFYGDNLATSSFIV